MVHSDTLIMVAQQFEEISGIGRTNLRAWLNTVGMGAHTERHKSKCRMSSDDCS
jgi:hypothetical protein